jgi:hypothetical protein
MGVAVVAPLALVLLVHFPDQSRRPMPPHSAWFLGLFVLMSAAMAALFVVSPSRSLGRDLGALVLTGVLWLVSSCTLVFIWISTYGT